ncbi:hypothetical protein E2R23_08915 [Burkholderia pseudomallei]|uniref:Uncharacterized protein n=1 Tax=Burkholderia pseudomallei 1710a TaxID=320371 RepID=A0A0E1W8J2_BURPE|nr:conserved hypothetical protein [Burkholderia pseudomallei 1710a]QBL77890.1 hypothetical protein EYA82_08810 [Burkholderia pseudomallei]QBL84551.1 hypothetical protein EYA88_08765 [Burkholderia pseudomallei]QBP55031.1 hypothetical protein E2R23_08915 [Burkholderia pseudomallei]QBP61645.1 hypothetical protein E2R29_08745 [Burkholderia pseudomallei]
MGVVTSHRPPPSVVRRDGSAHAQAAPCRSSGNRRPSNHPRTGHPADAAIAVPTARRTDRRPPGLRRAENPPAALEKSFEFPATPRCVRVRRTIP